MTERIIVSMTSHPKRINNVSKSIFALLKKQTLPPDEIHLWLSEEEFLNKERDLPSDLYDISFHPKVHIHWLQYNTYVHKRHEIFKLTTDDDCVFLIDDDVYYDSTLIDTVMKYHNKYKNAIICYNKYSCHRYVGKHIIYAESKPEPTPMANLNRWCGQSMIPSVLYPKNILNESYQDIRNKTSPISDECWFQPWTVYYDIPIFHLNYDWGIDISPSTGKDTGIVSFSHKKDCNGYEKRDNWLNNVLTAYPDILVKYKRLFNYGK